MDLNKAEYKRLGDYIREVDVRNRDLKVTNLLGLSMTKQFRPSTSNIVGVDLSKYKIVHKDVFAFDTMSVIRVHKVPIAMNLSKSPIIVSPVYITFECKDANILNPKYLMMWFSRDEFDRYADFKSDAAVRGGYNWKELCDTPIYLPPIEQQQKIVSEYEAVTHRIHLNEQIIAKLEETAQALYRKMFVDEIDKEHLPEGWRIGTLGEIAEISSGKTCKDKSEQQIGTYQWAVAGASGIIGYTPTYNQDGNFITTGRVGTLGVVNRYDGKVFCADNVLIIKSIHYEYCYQILRSIDYKELAKGGVQSLITQTDLKNVEALLADEQTLKLFEEQVSCISSQVRLKKQENIKLTELQSLLLAKMGK